MGKGAVGNTLKWGKGGGAGAEVDALRGGGGDLCACSLAQRRVQHAVCAGHRAQDRAIERRGRPWRGIVAHEHTARFHCQ